MNSAHATVATIAAVLFSCGNALAQLALMDWGLGKYRVDIDYYRVDVVEVSEAGRDKAWRCRIGLQFAIPRSSERRCQ